MDRPPPEKGYAILLAYHFPPMIGAASQRAAAFVRHLPAMGWEPIVIATRAGFFHRDSRVEIPAVTVRRTASPELTSVLHRLFPPRDGAKDEGTGVVRPIEGGPIVAAARRFVREWVYVPDGQFGWIPFAAAAAQRTLEALPGPAVLFSTSVPHSAHLAAARIARRKQIPWVAEFRDPWSSSRGAYDRSRARARLDRALESRILARADALVVTADRTAQDFRAIHPSLGPDDVHVVRNGFDAVDLAITPPKRTDPLSLVFLGNVPLQISPEPLLRAVQRVAEVSPGEVELRVVGPPAMWEEPAARLGNPPWLSLEGLVPPSEAQQAIRSASANVLYLPGNPYRLPVAAKFYEYLGARRPILAVLPTESEMESPLGQRFGDVRVVYPGDDDGLEAAIAQLLEEHLAGRLEEPVTPSEPLDELSWKAQVRRLAEVFDAVASGRRSTPR
jgi:glycosyltransferase involved in cell wall biosynthesis